MSKTITSEMERKKAQEGRGHGRNALERDGREERRERRGAQMNSARFNKLI